MLERFRRWRDRVFGRPVEGDESRAGKNLDALSAAASGSQRGTGSQVSDHGNIPPGYVPTDWGDDRPQR
jgi:hypothetical protein